MWSAQSVSTAPEWLIGRAVMVIITGRKGRRAGRVVPIAEALEPGMQHCLHHLPLRLSILLGFHSFSPRLRKESFFLYSHILRNQSHLLFLRVTAHLHSDLLFAGLPFESQAIWVSRSWEKPQGVHQVQATKPTATF